MVMKRKLPTKVIMTNSKIKINAEDKQFDLDVDSEDPDNNDEYFIGRLLNDLKIFVSAMCKNSQAKYCQVYSWTNA